MKHLRQSGRTTRLIEEAKRLSLEGKSVCIILENPMHERMIRFALHDGFRSIKTETVESLKSFDWTTMTCPKYPNCAFLVDHYAIEATFSRMFQMLHRFDPPEPEFKNETMAEPWGKKP